MISLPNYKIIRLSVPAKNDLKLIADYTEQEWGSNQKLTYLSYFNSFFKKLNINGNFGNHRDDIDKGLFCFTIKKHVVFYRETEDEFTVIRILHVSMNVEKHLKEL